MTHKSQATRHSVLESGDIALGGDLAGETGLRVADASVTTRGRDERVDALYWRVLDRVSLV